MDKLGIGIEVEIDRNKLVVGDETTVCSQAEGAGRVMVKFPQICKSEAEGSQQCNPQTESEGQRTEKAGVWWQERMEILRKRGKIFSSPHVGTAPEFSVV